MWVSTDIGDVGEFVGLDVTAHSAGWVARRLGVAPATLRTWHLRYRLGPSGRTKGGHRRYLPEDLERLVRMRRLVLAGMPTAEAARACAELQPVPPASTRPAHRDGPAISPAWAGKQSLRLTDAAMAFDQRTAEPMLTAALRRYGVAPTWMQLILPVLNILGERYALYGDCVAVEHLFTECVRGTLCAVVARRRRWDDYPPVLLACPDQEHHSLPLYVLAAALAELGCPTRIVGASVPTDAMVMATRQISPRAVFVWAQTPATARLADLRALARRRPVVPIVVGGPGWRDYALPARLTRVDSLTTAIAALSHDIPGPAAERR